jgi:hypothetical protein
MTIALHRCLYLASLVVALSACAGDEATPSSADQPPVETTLPPGRLPAEDCERQTALSGEGACRARWWCSDGKMRELICVVADEETRCVCLFGEESDGETDESASGGAGTEEPEEPEAATPVDGDRCQDADELGALAESACGWEVP